MSTIGVAPSPSSWSQPIFNQKSPSVSEATEMSTEEWTYLGICAMAILFLIGTFILKRIDVDSKTKAKIKWARYENVNKRGGT